MVQATYQTDVTIMGKVGMGTTNPTTDLSFGGGEICEGEAYVSMDTTDGSDTGALHLGGGGTPLPTRGAGIDLYGNEQSTLPGLLGLHSGGNGNIVLLPSGTGNVEISTTTGALLFPRMTTAQKDALTAINGMIVYDSTLNKFQGYENGAWVNLV